MAKDTRKDFIGGALVGVVVSFGLWFIVRNLIEAKILEGTQNLRAEVDRRIPPLVANAIQTKLDAAGLTRESGQKLARALTALHI